MYRLQPSVPTTKASKAEMFTALFQPIDLAQLVVAVPSFFFYLSFLFVAIRRRHEHPFDSTFFKVSWFVGFGDCLMLLTSNLLLKPPRWGFLPHVYLR